MKIYVTKYALTKGIQEFDGFLSQHNKTMMIVEARDAGSHAQFFHKGQWFATRAEAVKRAELLRTRKLAALRRQAQDLAALKFDVES